MTSLPVVSKTHPPLDLRNIQGDILAGLPKKVETYYFFGIRDVDAFRLRLIQLLPLITTAAQVMKDREKIDRHKKHGQEREALLKTSGVNLAFSQKGLVQMGIGKDPSDRIGDAPFEAGMSEDNKLNDDQNLWDPAFKQEIHGLIVLTGDCQATVEEKLAEVKKILGTSIHEIKRIDGNVRPGDQDGHEHFGYLDGVAQPAVLGVDENLHRGQETVHQGIILLGREGDNENDQDTPPQPRPRPRPSWALDGSFLCFRFLKQKVLEFDKFVKDNNPPEAADDLLGARLVGRWKSGAPIDITPRQDDKELGRDASRNDDFRYDPFSQDRCPFVAHTRKTNPRSDLASTESHRILRRGIPYGPEVTKAEKKAGKTQEDRGLLFKAYQSNISNGFQFLQSSWANNPGFPFLFNFKVPKPGFKPGPGGAGFDAIIGQQKPGDPLRVVDIKGGDDAAGKFTLPELWVVSKGGEYFFSPAIPALEDTFAKGKAFPPQRQGL